LTVTVVLSAAILHSSALAQDVRLKPLAAGQSEAARAAGTDPRTGCKHKIECFMETVQEVDAPPLDRKKIAKNDLSHAQQAWAENGALWLENFIPGGQADRYVDFWKKNSPGKGGWSYPTPYVEHKEIRDFALYPPLMDLMQKILGGEMVLHLTLTGFQTTTRSWHQDDFLNPACVNSWYAAVWVALEDIHPHSGPFQYVPGSHHWPLLRQTKVKRQLSEREAKSNMWPTYSERILKPLFTEKFDRHNLRPVDFVAKKGDVLIWHGRLAHQGSKALNTTLDRKSLIMHYTERDHHLCGTAQSKAQLHRRQEGKLYYNYSTRPK